MVFGSTGTVHQVTSCHNTWNSCGSFIARVKEISLDVRKILISTKQKKDIQVYQSASKCQRYYQEVQWVRKKTARGSKWIIWALSREPRTTTTTLVSDVVKSGCDVSEQILESSTGMDCRPKKMPPRQTEVCQGQPDYTYRKLFDQMKQPTPIWVVEITQTTYILKSRNSGGSLWGGFSA